MCQESASSPKTLPGTSREKNYDQQVSDSALLSVDEQYFEGDLTREAGPIEDLPASPPAFPPPKVLALFFNCDICCIFHVLYFNPTKYFAMPFA